jgi:hypothetical protein
MARRQRPERRESTPDSYISSGVVAAVLAGALAGVSGFDDGDPGIYIAVIGGVIAQVLLGIGIVAKGVEVGYRAAKSAEDGPTTPS